MAQTQKLILEYLQEFEESLNLFTCTFTHLHICTFANSYLNSDSPIDFNLNLEHNFAFTEMLDGYDPANADHKSKDSLTVLNVGIKYSFGMRRAYY